MGRPRAAARPPSGSPRPAWAATPANLLPSYSSFADLDQACGSFCAEVNARPHRATRRRPRLTCPPGSSAGLHPVPVVPFTAALGVTRKAGGLSLVSFGGGRYSVPHQLAGQPVWARRHGDDAYDRRCRAGRPGRGRPAPGSPARAAPASATRTTRRRRGPRGEGPAGPDAGGGRVPGHRRRRLPAGWPRPPQPAPAGSGRRWPRPSSCPGCTRPLTWTGPWGRPPQPAGSATVTWTPSWPTRPPPRDGTPAQASEDRTLAQGTGSGPGPAAAR